MPEPRKTVVTDSEWKILNALREIQEGPLRDLLLKQLEELVAFVKAPQCTKAQADGLPCQTNDVDCVECLKVHETLERVGVMLVDAREVG